MNLVAVNWHIHHAKSGGGQILICIAGRGYYQEEGKEAVEMKPGDCVNIPAEVKHWHGAAPDECFSHLAIEGPGEKTSSLKCANCGANSFSVFLPAVCTIFFTSITCPYFNCAPSLKAFPTRSPSL